MIFFTGEVCEELLNPCAYSVCVPGTHCKPQEEGGFECDCSKQDPTCDTGEEVFTYLLIPLFLCKKEII